MTTVPASLSSAPGKGLRIALWIVQVVVAAFFLMAGGTKGIRPLSDISVMIPWVPDVPAALTRFIGWAEIAGGLGLILPAATRIAPWLTPLAAAGLATIMVLAIGFHLMRGEASVIGTHIILGMLAAFVAWGRWRQAPIAPRA